MSHHILPQAVFVGHFWRKFAVKEAFRSTSIVILMVRLARFWWQLTCLSWKHRPALIDSTIAGVPPSSLLSISSTYTCLSFITCRNEHRERRDNRKIQKSKTGIQTRIATGSHNWSLPNEVRDYIAGCCVLYERINEEKAFEKGMSLRTWQQ